MKYIESPTECSGGGKDVKLFLAGGITGTEDWQSEVVKLLETSNLTLINPRRKNWDDIDLKLEPKIVEISQKLLGMKEACAIAIVNNNEKEAKQLEFDIRICEHRLKDLLTPGTIQIEWEYIHLLRADAIMFWFPSETLCPIALYELGRWNGHPKPVFIGCHPDYKRKHDIIQQTRLCDPRKKVVFSIIELVDQILRWETTLSKKTNE